MFIVAFLFSAFRYNVGYDYHTYFVAAQTGIVPNYWEPIPKLLIHVSYFADSPHLFFILTSLWIIGFTFAGTNKYAKVSVFPFLLFLLYPFLYLSSFSIIRQFMAISYLFFISHLLFVKQRVLLFVLLSFIAGLCHCTAFFASGIFVAIYYIVFKFKIERRATIVVAALGATMLAVFVLRHTLSNYIIDLIGFLEVRYANYLTVHETFGGQKAVYMNLTLTLIIIFRVLSYANKTRKMLLFLTITSVGVILESLLSNFGHIGLRFALYFYSFLPLAFYIVYKKERGLLKLLCASVIIAIFVLFFFYTIYLDLQKPKLDLKPQYVPYYTIYIVN
jgi:hypothetical protein